jgi:ABC-2 type transport system permease protein
VNARRLVAIVRRVIQEIRRDERSIALLFMAPILVTGLVTFILRESQTPEVHAVIVNEAGMPGTILGSALTTALEADGATVAEAVDLSDARARIEDGRASVGLVLPEGLGIGGAGGIPTITVLTNGLDPASESGQVAALQKAVMRAVSSGSGAAIPTIRHETVYGTPSDDPMANFAPALVGFFVYFFVYLLTGVSFLRERTGGTLERLMATPVTRAEIVVGYALGFGAFAVAQVAVIMTWVLGRLDVPAIGPLPSFSIGLGVQVAGSPLMAFLVVVLLALGAVSLGIFFSTFARTELQIIQFIPLVIVPQFLLSGVIFPVSSIPAILQPVKGILPLTYAVDGLRQVFVRGADLGVGPLQADLLVLAAFAILFAAIAALTIRRDVA